MIDSLSDRFSTAWLCRQLGVARSGFYDWRQRQHNPGPRAQKNVAITAQIQTVCCWAGDITYLRRTAGWRYLAAWIDL